MAEPQETDRGMTKSYLQDEFLRVLALVHKATAMRILDKVERLDLPPELYADIKSMVEQELRGLFHGTLVVFDGGSSLADTGMVRIIDDRGVFLSSWLHEICLSAYDNARES